MTNPNTMTAANAKWTDADVDDLERHLTAIVAMIDDTVFREAVQTRVCGACGCLCRVDESCPSCVVRLGVTAAAVRLPEGLGS